MADKLAFVIIGGGIAGVSCIESLFQAYADQPRLFERLVLISDKKLVKKVANYDKAGRSLETFKVTQTHIDTLQDNKPAGLIFQTILAFVEQIDPHKKLIYYQCHDGSRSTITYNLLSICIGAAPHKLMCREMPPNVLDNVIVIRDTTSVQRLAERLKSCKRVVIVGNGGIGLELIHKIDCCDKTWIIRDKHIGGPFLDSELTQFMLDSMEKEATKREYETPISNHFAQDTQINSGDDRLGPALGPCWSQDTNLRGSNKDPRPVEVIYDDEVDRVEMQESNEVLVTTLKGRKINCDIILSATGVKPNHVRLVDEFQFLRGQLDQGVLVDTQMRTSIEGIYGAGDFVSCESWPKNDLWFQMRLWTQARQMGHYAGVCMASHVRREDPSIYFMFDCFTHCTSFFGYKVVLLGQYNAQHLSNTCDNCEILLRVIPQKEYIKLVLVNNKVIGATLVGETGLEETIENLIHDGLDIASVKDHLLDRTVDIDDYFD